MRPSRCLSGPAVFCLVPGVFAGCHSAPAANRMFPTLSPLSFPRCLVLIPTVPPSPLTCFFLDLIGLPSTPLRSASRISHQHDFSVVKFRAWQTFRYVQAAEFARLPDHSYRCKLAAGQLRLLLPGTTCFVTSARTAYAMRPNTAN